MSMHGKAPDCVSEPGSTTPADAYYEHVRLDICDLVSRHSPTPQPKVLDLGCASGRLGETLKARGIAPVVDGIEVDRFAADEAAGRLDHVWVGNLADFDWSSVARYDVVVAADVLEHLADPWKTLRELQHVLTPSGKVIASIPNVRYWKVIWDLLFRGDFRYVEAGVLDRTHLRFFTRTSLERLFSETGYRIEYLQAKPIERPALHRLIMAAAGDLAHVQYHVVARPQVAGVSPNASRQPRSGENGPPADAVPDV